MRKLFGRDKPKRAADEDTSLPPPQPYPLSGSRSSSFSSLPLPTKSIKPEREGDTRWSRKKQPQPGGVVPAVGILRALDPHVEVTHPGTLVDEHTSQYESSIRDDKKEWKFFGERKEREKDSERGRNRDRGEREEDGQAELTRMIGVMTPSVPSSLVVLIARQAI